MFPTCRLKTTGTKQIIAKSKIKHRIDVNFLLHFSILLLSFVVFMCNKVLTVLPVVCDRVFNKKKRTSSSHVRSECLQSSVIFIPKMLKIEVMDSGNIDFIFSSTARSAKELL